MFARRSVWAVTMTAGFALPGCGANVLNEGTDCEADGGMTAPSRADFPPSNELHELNCPAAVENDNAEVWDGTFDDHVLLSGSLAIRASLKVPSSVFPAARCGTMTFGTGAAPPIATDPDRAPPGTASLLRGTTLGRLPEPVEGFPYQIYGYSTESGWGNTADRRHFALNSNQPFKSWCELQWSYPPRTPAGEGGRYTCLPEAAGWQTSSDADGACTFFPGHAGHANAFIPEEVPCAKLILCHLDWACGCGSWGCSLFPRPDVFVDLHPAGDSWAGSIVWQGNVHAVHFARPTR